jgi:hypothetical protein
MKRKERERANRTEWAGVLCVCVYVWEDGKGGTEGMEEMVGRKEKVRRKEKVGRERGMNRQ